MPRASAKAVFIALMLTACARQPTVYKVALVAPFEGHARDVGYGVFPEFRALLQRAVQAHPIATAQFTFVAYNDNADPAFAARVAQNVALDETVLFVMGHLQAETTRATQPVYARANLPLLARCEGAKPVAGALWCTRGDINRDAAEVIEALHDFAHNGQPLSRASAARALDRVLGGP